MTKAKVLFEYSPQEEDELTLRVGDLILEVEPADTGWCKGLLNGTRGLFPDNFVQMIEEEDKKAPPPPSANKKPSKKSKIKKMKINYSYVADNDDEISLEVGDIVEIIKDVEEGWAEGINKGKKGVFPTNFGELLPESSESEESADGGLDHKVEEAKEEASQNDEPLATSSQKKVKGIGFGNIFGDGPIKLRQRSIGEADKKKNLSTTPAKPVKEKELTKDLHSSSGKPKKNVEYCKVMFDYKVENDDELALSRGEIIVIIDKEGGDDGWWEGEKVDENGKKMRGMFPDNFVTELSPEEAREHERKLQGKPEPDTSKDSKYGKSPSTKDSGPSSSLKKPAPVLPPPPSQSSKPAASLDNGEVMEEETMTIFDEATTTDHTLVHVKRPVGPKRRRPGAAERREKAQSAYLETQNGDIESEEEKVTKTEVQDQPTTNKKDSAKRGVAVLPGLSGPGGDGATGETPSWLQNLKNRQSQKRPPGTAASPAPAPGPKDSSPSDASSKPAWLQNLKKRQSSEFPSAAARPKSPEKMVTQPAKPAEKVALQPTKVDKPPHKPPNNHPPTAVPAKPPGPAKSAQKPVAPPPSEKPLAAWQIERQQKARKQKGSDGSEDPAPEPPSSGAAGEPATSPSAWKNSLPKKTPPPHNVAKQVTSDPPVTKKVEKPAIGTPITTPASVGGIRAKPAVPRMKPAPAAKPASSTMVEELKEEMKRMKEEMEKMKDETRKEIQKLNLELQEEKKQRLALQGEVSRLRQQLSS